MPQDIDKFLDKVMTSTMQGAEAALGHSLSAIEASLKAIASTHDASPTKASGGRRKSSGGKKGRGGGMCGGGNWELAHIVGCAMAAAGRIACETGLGEEHVEQVGTLEASMNGERIIRK